MNIIKKFHTRFNSAPDKQKNTIFISIICTLIVGFMSILLLNNIIHGNIMKDYIIYRIVAMFVLAIEYVFVLLFLYVCYREIALLMADSDIVIDVDKIQTATYNSVVNESATLLV